MGAEAASAVRQEHELKLAEVKQLRIDTPKIWGWANVDRSSFFMGGNDDLILLRFLRGHSYEPTTRSLWRKLCKGAELVADIGAHSGVFTLDAYQAGVTAVLAVEPHPINYARLIMNLRYNGFNYANAVFGALGDENAVGWLGVDHLSICHAAGSIGAAKARKIPTHIMRMDSILPQEAWPKLKAVKIDAEGFTPKALRGMGGILEHHPDLILECLEGGMDEILRPYGYRFWRIWETGKIEEVDNLEPYNPDLSYNGTDEDCKNRFASVRDLP